MTALDRPGLGVALRILSGLLMAGMYVCVKAVSDHVPLGEIVFFRSFFALIPLALFLWVRHEFPGGLATRRPLDHLLRSAFGAAALFLSFAALARLSIAEAVLIAQLSPILMAMAAVWILAERLTAWRIAGLCFGLAGVVVLVWPDLRADTVDAARMIGVALALTAAALSALALIMVRRLNRTESPGAIAFYFALASMIAALFAAPADWIAPDREALAYLIGSGLFGGFGHIAMTLAFRYAEASRIAPFEYVGLLWPVAADVLIFQFPLSAAFIMAAPLVLAGAAVAAMERRGPRGAASP